MDPDAHDPSARIDELTTDLPQRCGRLADIPGNVGSRLDHRLEELAADVASDRTRFANDVAAAIGQFVVGPDEQQFLLNPK